MDELSIVFLVKHSIDPNFSISLRKYPLISDIVIDLHYMNVRFDNLYSNITGRRAKRPIAALGLNSSVVNELLFL